MKKKIIPVTIVISILNEDQTIEQLLQGLVEQTVSAKNIIFVDASSNDSIKSKLSALPELKTQYLHRDGTNRSQARNIGIHQADTEIIVITDAGCIPKPDWLEKITQAFFADPKTEVVAGFYDPDPQNQFEEIVANTTSVRDWNFDPKTFLPSSRSVAFTKQIWKTVGGYDEKLVHNEDLPFAEELKKHSKHWRIAQNAQVIWRQPTSLSDLMNKLSRYAVGDLEVDLERHVRKIHSAVWRMTILVVLGIPMVFTRLPILQMFGVSLFGLYGIGALVRHRRAYRNVAYFLYAPYIQMGVDVALFQAWVFHYLQKFSKTPFA